MKLINYTIRPSHAQKENDPSMTLNDQKEMYAIMRQLKNEEDLVSVLSEMKEFSREVISNVIGSWARSHCKNKADIDNMLYHIDQDQHCPIQVDPELKAVVTAHWVAEKVQDKDSALHYTNQFQTVALQNMVATQWAFDKKRTNVDEVLDIFKTYPSIPKEDQAQALLQLMNRYRVPKNFDQTVHVLQLCNSHLPSLYGDEDDYEMKLAYMPMLRSFLDQNQALSQEHIRIIINKIPDVEEQENIACKWFENITPDVDSVECLLDYVTDTDKRYHAIVRLFDESPTPIVVSTIDNDEIRNVLRKLEIDARGNALTMESFRDSSDDLEEKLAIATHLVHHDLDSDNLCEIVAAFDGDATQVAQLTQQWMSSRRQCIMADLERALPHLAEFDDQMQLVEKWSKNRIGPDIRQYLSDNKGTIRHPHYQCKADIGLDSLTLLLPFVVRLQDRIDIASSYCLGLDEADRCHAFTQLSDVIFQQEDKHNNSEKPVKALYEKCQLHELLSCDFDGFMAIEEEKRKAQEAELEAVKHHIEVRQPQATLAPDIDSVNHLATQSQFGCCAIS